MKLSGKNTQIKTYRFLFISLSKVRGSTNKKKIKKEYPDQTASLSSAGIQKSERVLRASQWIFRMEF
jgi:hypothetical protein